MRALAVLSPSLYEKTDARKRHLFAIDQHQIPLGFVTANPPDFDTNATTTANYVLVRKTSFSLNYRDLGIIEQAWKKVRDMEQETFYPIGSDFCGIVEEVGSNVTTLQVGDKVIGNNFFPYPEDNAMPGIPSNHASREFEIYHHGKLMKVPDEIPEEQAGSMSIGAQTAAAMIRKANIKDGDVVLVTSVTSNTSFFFLNLLKDKNCTVYGLSYSGKNTDTVKRHFPFIKEIFSFKDMVFPDHLYFDVVLDAFADTYLTALCSRLNFNARYLTCGVYNQSSEKMKTTEKINLTTLIADLMFRNVQLIANCLGTGEDLKNGIDGFKNDTLVIDQVFTDENALTSFLEKTYNSEGNKFGKVSFKYS
ncbi:zinc-binding alcohol dehydrogenase family protein [Flavobacterium sp. WV_118_3]|uniref:zinc-binding alcohol dehydrogenase family protein n=1 Tax=Flavobacterium sp. WV_118_3 TaxID=3151764 RepID=UPI00321A6240